MPHRLAAAACLAIAVAGCFNPRPPPNLMCGPGNSCPPGMTCGFEGVCHPDGTGVDAPSAIDAPPDSPAVACQGDQDCKTPPGLCSTAGTCNLTSHTCQFGSVDCSSMDDGCNLGVCDLGTGACVARARNEGNTCSAGTECAPFGECGDFESACDASGTQSRSCTDHTCRSGSCVASSRDEVANCMRNTNGKMCADPTEPSCTVCGFSDDCDNTGTQDCTRTTFACQNEVCMPTSATITVGCTRNTDGFMCGCERCGAVGRPLLCSGGTCSRLGPCGDCTLISPPAPIAPTAPAALAAPQ